MRVTFCVRRRETRPSVARARSKEARADDALPAAMQHEIRLGAGDLAILRLLPAKRRKRFGCELLPKRNVPRTRCARPSSRREPLLRAPACRELRSVDTQIAPGGPSTARTRPSDTLILRQARLRTRWTPRMVRTPRALSEGHLRRRPSERVGSFRRACTRSMTGSIAATERKREPWVRFYTQR